MRHTAITPSVMTRSTTPGPVLLTPVCADTSTTTEHPDGEHTAADIACINFLTTAMINLGDDREAMSTCSSAMVWDAHTHNRNAAMRSDIFEAYKML